MMSHSEIMELPNIENRFWSKVDKRGANVCWEWTANKSRGYGLLTTKRNCAPIKAHRLSWMLHYGEIPSGMAICHSCDNPGCVNPNHLMLGTQKANMIDAAKKGKLRFFRFGVGEDNNAAKLSDEQVRSMRRDYATGKFTYKEMAKKYGVSDCAAILRNISYHDPEFNPINGNRKPRPSRKVVTEEIKKKIMQSEKSAYRLSKELQISKPTILKIRNGDY